MNQFLENCIKIILFLSCFKIYGNLDECLTNCNQNYNECASYCISNFACSQECATEFAIDNNMQRCACVEEIRNCIDNCRQERSDCNNFCLNNFCLSPWIACPSCAMDF